MNSIEKFYKAITKQPLVILFLLFTGLQSFSIAQTTTFQISGYCNTVLSYVSQTVITNDGYYSMYGVTVDSTYAYLAGGNKGFEIFNISNPANPIVVTNEYDQPYFVGCVAVNGNYAYLGVISQLNSDEIHIVDITDKSNPILVETLSFQSGISRIKINGNFAYIAGTSSGLLILDISNPTTAIQVGSYITLGNAIDVAIQGKYAYVADDTAGLIIIDISNPSNPFEVGYCNTPSSAKGVSVNSTYACIADYASGLQIINITDPTNPMAIGYYDSFSPTGSVVVLNNYVYIADNPGNIQMIDISNPYNPQETGYNLNNFSNNVFGISIAVQGNYLYEIANSYPFAVFGIYKIKDPFSSATITLSGNTSLTTTTDSTGYYEFANLTYGNYSVIPEIDGYINYPPQYVYSGITSNQTLQSFIVATECAALIANNINGVFSDMLFTQDSCFVLSISSTLSTGSGIQTLFTSWSDNEPISHYVCVGWNTTFTAYYSGSQYYLTTQANPSTVGYVSPTSQWYSSGSTVICQAYPNLGYIFTNWSGDLSSRMTTDYIVMNASKSIQANFIPISVLSTNYTISGYCNRFPYEVGQVATPGTAYAVKVVGNYAYVADWDHGLRVIDISNPISPVEVGSSEYAGGADDLAIQGNYAYIADGSIGLRIVDISNPSAPIEVGLYNNGQNITGVAVNGNYAYLADNSFGLRIVDVSNPSNPVEVGNYLTVSTIYTGILGNTPYRIAMKDHYVYLTIGGGVFGETNIGGDVSIFDVSDPTNPINVSSVSLGTFAYGITIDGDTVYVTELGGSYWIGWDIYYVPANLDIIDVSNPTQPILRNSIGVPYYAEGVAVQNNFAYIANNGYGLTIINVQNGLQIGSLDTAGDSLGITSIGDYAYLADGSNGLKIIHVVEPLSQVPISLSGDTNLLDITDTTGYYEFTNLTYGFYTTTPIQQFYVYSSQNYSPLTTDYSNQNFYRNEYSEYTSTMGDFSDASYLALWAFQPANGVSNQASFSWLSTYQGDSGILQINFSTATQGLKLTSFARFTPSTTNPWYRLRVTYYCDAPCEHEQILPLILFYDSDQSQTVQELGAAYTGNTLIQPGQWNTIETYVHCNSTTTISGQIQLMAKNYGDTGAMYIDSIDLDNVAPPAITSPTYVSVTIGDFATGDETTGWGFQNTLNGSNGQPTISWVSTVNGQTGVLALSFTTSSQGVKMTSKDVYYIPAGDNAIMSFKIATDQTSPSSLSLMAFQYAEKDVVNEVFDIGAYGNFGVLSGSTAWTTCYVPLTSLSQSTHRLQLLIQNESQYPETIYLDDIELFYGADSPNDEKEILLVSKPRELLN